MKVEARVRQTPMVVDEVVKTRMRRGRVLKNGIRKEMKIEKEIEETGKVVGKEGRRARIEEIAGNGIEKIETTIGLKILIETRMQTGVETGIETVIGLETIGGMTIEGTNGILIHLKGLYSCRDEEKIRQTRMKMEEVVEPW